MKNRIVVILILGLALGSCSKETDVTNPLCAEAPPTGELCEAAFERWFYNAEKNKCEKIGYSGCNTYGFATKEECEACDCD